MKIVSIFTPKLFAFHYENNDDNEYDRNIELWQDANYLHKFAGKYVPKKDPVKYINDRFKDAEQIIDTIEEITNNKKDKLETFFQPLYES
ncbi:MAG: hypothetical protein PF481_04085 [Bacteroidales bacterium]|jgi:type I restriction-modification system DNA methylase subunit|nr:hypothetical protein [Bacteroidales bacterium]